VTSRIGSPDAPFVNGLLPKRDGDLCKRLRFKWYGARKSFYLECPLRKVHAGINGVCTENVRSTTPETSSYKR